MNNTVVMAIIAVICTVGLCVYAYIKDKKEKEPVWLLGILFGLSALFYALVSSPLQRLLTGFFSRLYSGEYTVDPETGVVWSDPDSRTFYLILCSLVGIALVEELVRWFVLYAVTKNSRHFNCLFDGIVYSIVVSMGAVLAKSLILAFSAGWNQFLLGFLRAFAWYSFSGIFMGVLFSSWYVKRKANRLENKLIAEKKLIRKDKLKYPAGALLSSIAVPIFFHTVYSYVEDRMDNASGWVYWILFGLTAAILVLCIWLIAGHALEDETHRKAVEEIIEKEHGNLPDEVYRDVDTPPGVRNRIEACFDRHPVLPYFAALLIFALAFLSVRLVAGRPSANASGGADTNVVFVGKETSEEKEQESHAESSASEGDVSGESPNTEPSSDNSADSSADLSVSPGGSAAAVGSGYNYYYDLLDDADKRIYAALYAALTKGDGSVKIAGLAGRPMSEFHKVHIALGRDHPEIFLYDMNTCYGYDDGEAKHLYYKKLKYWELATGVDAFAKFLDTVVQRIADEAKKNCANDYEKALYVHDYLITHAYYDHDGLQEIKDDPEHYNPTNRLIYSAYGCLVMGKCVCAGYAQAYKLILDRLGIPCVYVTGWTDPESKSIGVGHAWNRITLDGESYYVDVTWDDYWDDVVIDGERLFENASDYRYCNITTADLLASREIDEKYFPQPLCDAETYNYFRYNGYVLEEYDFDAMMKIIEKQKDRPAAIVRFASGEDLAKAYDDFTNKRLYREYDCMKGREFYHSFNTTRWPACGYVFFVK